MFSDRLLHIHIDRTGGHLLWEVVRGLGLKLDGPPNEPYSVMVERCTQQGIEVPPAITFTRNPWEWYVSRWTQNCRRGDFEGEFKDYLRILQENSGRGRHIVRMSDWWDEMECGRADHIGRFETLHDDIIRILLAIIPDVATEEKIRHLFDTLPWQKAAITPSGEHPGPHYTWYDAESQAWVAEWDARLIEAFGYAFDDPTAWMQEARRGV